MPKCQWAMNTFAANHTCVMVYSHRLYYIVAKSAVHSFLTFALLSKQLFRDFPVIMYTSYLISGGLLELPLPYI